MSKITYTDASNVQHEVSKIEFLQLIKQGLITSDTPVNINGRSGLARQISGLESLFANPHDNVVKKREEVEEDHIKLADSGTTSKKEDDSSPNARSGIEGVWGNIQNAVSCLATQLPQFQGEQIVSSSSVRLNKGENSEKSTAEESEETFISEDTNNGRKREPQAPPNFKANIMLTTCSNFEGYRIVRYCGFVAGDETLLLDRGSGIIESSISKVIFGFFSSLSKRIAGKSLPNSSARDYIDINNDLVAELPCKRMLVLDKVRKLANALGANAIVGLDFKMTVVPMETVDAIGRRIYQPYLFTITATGTAVEIKKFS